MNVKFRKNYFVLFIIWIIILFTLTSIPRLHSPVNDALNIDKLAHLFVYLVFAFLFVKMHKEKQYVLKKLCFLAAVVPLFDELHQIPIPGRTFSYLDIIADISGFMIIFFYFKFRNY